MAVEASGGYERKVAAEMHSRRIAVVVVNPTRVRAYAIAAGQLAKTDKIDARMIAAYAAVMTPQPQEQKSDQQRELEALVTRRQQLVGMLSQERTRLHTTPDITQSHVERHILWLREELDDLEKQVAAHIQRHPEWGKKPPLWKPLRGVAP